MKYISLLALLLLFFFSACEDDDPAAGAVDLNLEFRADFAGNPLAISSETYNYPTGADLKMLLFQYYVSDLELIPADGGNPVQLTDIDLIRWQSATESSVTTRTYEVPAGDYSGLRFGLGVSPDLNAREPSEFAADFVLNENEFWNASTRYVFAKIEANADLESDGTFDTPLTYHMGSDAVYFTVTFNQDFSIDGESDPQLTIVADVLAAMSDGTDTFDIADPDRQRVHGGNQAVALDIWNRLAGQFVLEIR